MQNSKTGRNDPCPCGSGKKYKRCCLGKGDDSVSTVKPAQDVFNDLHQALDDEEFSSLEEAQEFATQFMQQSNKRPVDEFHGLSPQQMAQILNAPFDSPQVAHFADSIVTADHAPIMLLFNLMIEAIGEDGLKTTAKGNLPQKFCREAAEKYLEKHEWPRPTRNTKVNIEEDFFDLHVTRLVAQTAGFIRKYKGRFILSRQCRALLADGGSAFYPMLFRAFVEKYNWSYGDGYPEIPFIQHAFLFSLYLLQRYGSECKSTQFYEENFLKAFPVVLDDIEDEIYMSREDIFFSAYRLRFFERFAQFMGLVEVAIGTDKEEIFPFLTYKITKHPLLSQVVQFRHPTVVSSL